MVIAGRVVPVEIDKEGFERGFAVRGAVQEQEDALGGEGIGDGALVVTRLRQRMDGAVERDPRSLIDILGNQWFCWRLGESRKRYCASENQRQPS